MHVISDDHAGIVLEGEIAAVARAQIGVVERLERILIEVERCAIALFVKPCGAMSRLTPTVAIQCALDFGGECVLGKRYGFVDVLALGGDGEAGPSQYALQHVTAVVDDIAGFKHVLGIATTRVVDISVYKGAIRCRVAGRQGFMKVDGVVGKDIARAARGKTAHVFQNGLAMGCIYNVLGVAFVKKSTAGSCAHGVEIHE